MSTVAPDLNSAQWAFEQGTKMPFRMTDKLVEVWCEQAEMEICNEWVFLGATFGVISDSIPPLNYHNIFFAKFYKQGGVMSMVAPDLNSAQQAFEWGTRCHSGWQTS